MHRFEAGHRPSLTRNLHGSSGHHISASNANPIMIPETAAHLPAPRRPQSTISMAAEGGATSFVAMNQAIDTPIGRGAKAPASRRLRCLRDARATCEKAKEGHVHSLDGKMEASAGTMCDQFMRAACSPPSISSFSGTSSSLFHATFRSHSFGGEQPFHRPLAGSTGMGTPVGCELENSDGSSNLSLHYLITTARRGKTRPYSANASPITGGNISCGGGRRLIKVDLGARQELDKAVSELTRWATLDQAPDQEPDSRVKVAVDMAISHCALTGNEEPQARTDSSSVITPRIKRNSSCSDERSNECAVSMAPIAKPIQHKKSRLLSGAADSGMNSVASSVASVEGQQPVLRLPDPSTISDRRTLLAMSRLMCSRSSIESFGNCSHAAADPADCSPPCPSLSSSSEMVESSDGGRDGHAVDSRHRDEVTRWTLPNTGASALGHADDVKSISEDTGISLLHITLDEDDDATCASSSSPQDLRCLQGSPRLPKSSFLCRNRQEEDDSVAFSVDSVHVRKKQLGDSQHTLFNGERTIQTDWAADSVNYSNANGWHSHETRPPRQISCEIDMDAIKYDSILHRNSQLVPTGSDDDEERSFASVSSLDTNLSERV